MSTARCQKASFYLRNGGWMHLRNYQESRVKFFLINEVARQIPTCTVLIKTYNLYNKLFPLEFIGNLPPGL